VCQWIIAGIVTLLFLDVLYKAMNYFLQESPEDDTITRNFQSAQKTLKGVSKWVGDANGTFVLNFIILSAGIVLKSISYIAMHQAYKFSVAME